MKGGVFLDMGRRNTPDHEVFFLQQTLSLRGTQEEEEAWLPELAVWVEDI